MDIARSTLNAGGCGYVIKSDAGSELLAAIEAVFLGRQFVSARLATQSISGVAKT
jgi:DNA-binding NarL/FixJ family response regulator